MEPGTGLTNTTVFNPVGVYGPTIDSVRYKMIVLISLAVLTQHTSQSMFIKRFLMFLFPRPLQQNNDGLNDVIRPIAVGIRQINYFAVYNRWGERVFTLLLINKDGMAFIMAASRQAAYVWMLVAIDYTGKPLFLKGTVTLIR